MRLQVEQIPAESEAARDELDVKIGDVVDPETAASVASTEMEPVEWRADGAYTASGERVARLVSEIDLDDCLRRLAEYDMQRATVEPEGDGYRITRWHHPQGLSDEFFVAGPVGAAVSQMIRWEQERTSDIAVADWDADETQLIIAVAEVPA